MGTESTTGTASRCDALPCLLNLNLDSSDTILMQTLLKHVLEMKHDLRYGFRDTLFRIVEWHGKGRVNYLRWHTNIPVERRIRLIFPFVLAGLL